jgi:type I restriction enzyme M protein
MGYIYEELLRRFSEQSGEEAGEHFTPREVIRLMVELLEIPIPEKHLSIYDPACGTGGMLSVSKEHLLNRAANDTEKARVEKYVTVHGQELSPTNYAICQSDLIIKNDQQAKVFLGNSLIPHEPNSKEPGDQLSETKHRFDFMLSNPPFGVTWGGKDGYEKEARKLERTRYRAGMPRVNDGALLFLQTMLAKMKEPDKDGSRIAIIFNGSPLSNGDCGSGESEIRRWILENDWLDAIVMQPDQLFYNTGIFTYIWLLRNEKPAKHRGRVMIIDARKKFEKEPKSFGNKRNRMTDAHRHWIEERYREGWKPGYSDPDVKIFQNNGKVKDFAYHKVSVVFWQTDENDQPTIITEPYAKALSAANLKKEQDFYESDLTFRIRVKTVAGETVETLLLAPKDNASNKFKALMQKKPDIIAVDWTHRHYVQDDEYIPYGEDIDTFLKREIAKPIIRWKDSPQLGYEILPNKYFYRYEPPTPAKDLLDQFWKLEKEGEKMMKGLANDK